MNKTMMVGLGLSVLTMSAFVSGDSMAMDMNGWVFSGPGTGIVEGQGYSLFNTDKKEFLHMHNRAGVNLGWVASAPGNVHVKRQTGSGPLKCGDVFAIKVDNEWPMHHPQSVGINLSTRTALAPEWMQWKITKCTPGALVPLGSPVSLTNTVENDALVGCTRALGVDLCWANDVATLHGKNYRKADVPR